jgi:hypothetical protein
MMPFQMFTMDGVAYSVIATTPTTYRVWSAQKEIFIPKYYLDCPLTRKALRIKVIPYIITD